MEAQEEGPTGYRSVGSGGSPLSRRQAAPLLKTPLEKAAPLAKAMAWRVVVEKPVGAPKQQRAEKLGKARHTQVVVHVLRCYERRKN